MTKRGVLVLGLDGFEIGYAEQLIDAGELPALSALRCRSKRYLLDHGPAVRTGLAWEHFATGLTPEHARRASALELVDGAYNTRQLGTDLAPFYGSLDARVVLFDPPYTDIARAGGARGIVSWGAHDPGVNPASNPPELAGDLEARFGPYPSGEWTYAVPWPSATRTAEMGAALCRGLRTRREAATWLLTERFTDWDLAIVVGGEPHSAAEAFWHGVDPAHPLHDHPSAAPAAQGILDVYREVDRMVDELVTATAPRSVLVFSMGGMGNNHSDTPSMVLLPELVYRWATGHTLLDVPDDWSADPTAVPIIPEHQTWDEVLSACYPPTRYRTRPPLTKWVAARLPPSVRRSAKRVVPGLANRRALFTLDWVPASRYRSEWAKMRAFALPSLYDGRIRVNLRGREPAGIVDAADYTSTLDEVEDVVRACRDPRTDEPVVDCFERPGADDPFALDHSGADLVAVWRHHPCAFLHPELGLVGPAPYRRTGGHTGPYGFAYVSGPGIDAGDGGVRSAFDISPTVAALVCASPPPRIDGTSLLSAHV